MTCTSMRYKGRMDIIPVPTDEAVQEVEKRLLGTETNITNWQRKL